MIKRSRAGTGRGLVKSQTSQSTRITLPLRGNLLTAISK